MYERKYVVHGREAYLNYVMFTFPFYYYDYRNKKAGMTHTHTHTHRHTTRVISGLIHVYFLTFARFLNGKCLTHTNITHASRKSVQRG